MIKKVSLIICCLFFQISLPCFAANLNAEHIRAIGSFFPDSLDYLWPGHGYEIRDMVLERSHSRSENVLSLHFLKGSFGNELGHLHMTYSLIPADSKNPYINLYCHSSNRKLKIASSVGNLDFCIQSPQKGRQIETPVISANTRFKINNTLIQIHFNGTGKDLPLLLQSLQKKRTEHLPGTNWVSLYQAYYPKQSLVKVTQADYKLQSSNLQWGFQLQAEPKLVIYFHRNIKLSKTATHGLPAVITHTPALSIREPVCEPDYAKKIVNHAQFGPSVLCSSFNPQSGFTWTEAYPLKGNRFPNVFAQFWSYPHEIDAFFASLSPLIP